MQSGVNHWRDEGISTSIASAYSPEALKHPRSLLRNLNYIFKEQHLLFIHRGIPIGSAFFILQPTLSRLSPSDPSNSVTRSFSSTVCDRFNAASFSTDLHNNAGRRKKKNKLRKKREIRRVEYENKEGGVQASFSRGRTE